MIKLLLRLKRLFFRQNDFKAPLPKEQVTDQYAVRIDGKFQVRSNRIEARKQAEEYLVLYAGTKNPYTDKFPTKRQIARMFGAKDPSCLFHRNLPGAEKLNLTYAAMREIFELGKED